MFPILFAAKALAKMSSFGGGSKPARNTQSDAESEQTAEKVIDKQGKEHDADSPTGKMIINMTKEQEAPEMFGGMDLNKIKSALDEDSPLGMPEEVKGGVYKQIFEVNKMMLGSLQRIEGTLKLMLNLEYERALAFQQADVQQNLIEGDTDPDPDPDPESGPGRFRRGLTAAGSMLGGAYGKLKGSSITKLLGLGALIFAFNKYKDEIIAAMAGILEYFSDVYDVFKADGIGAAFDKVLDDFKTIFLPKIKEMSMNLLDFIWGAIKGVAIRWLYGAQGDERIAQESGDVATSMANLSDTSLDAGKAVQKLKTMGKSDVVLNTVSGTMKGLSGEETSALKDNMKELGESLTEISRQSGGRIQFTDLGDLTKNVNAKFVGLNYPVSTLLNTKPIIDGVISEFSDLENIKLNERAGITRGMTEEKQKMITDALYEKSLLAKKLYSTENRKIGDTFSLKDMISPEKFDKRKANDIARIERDIAAQDAILKNSGQVFAPMGVAEYNTPNKTPTQIAYDKIMKERAAREKATASRVLTPNLTSIGTNTVNNVNASTNNNIGLSAHPTSDTVKAFKSRQLQELIA